ncbi:MAG: hypothetical protein GF344_00225 [Chitinivibrionales bacterium]|nr:hypothetical protein [Chitinivibrionales bacterium]MBD3355557.1 hypothetical protein [Chitinivibrionales bacterium]
MSIGRSTFVRRLRGGVRRGGVQWGDVDNGGAHVAGVMRWSVVGGRCDPWWWWASGCGLAAMSPVDSSWIPPAEAMLGHALMWFVPLTAAVRVVLMEDAEFCEQSRKFGFDRVVGFEQGVGQLEDLLLDPRGAGVCFSCHDSCSGCGFGVALSLKRWKYLSHRMVLSSSVSSQRLFAIRTSCSSARGGGRGLRRARRRAASSRL